MVSVAVQWFTLLVFRLIVRVWFHLRFGQSTKRLHQQLKLKYDQHSTNNNNSNSQTVNQQTFKPNPARDRPCMVVQMCLCVCKCVCVVQQISVEKRLFTQMSSRKLNDGNSQAFWLKNPPKSSKTKTLLLMVLPNFDQSASADSRYWTITFRGFAMVGQSKHKSSILH